MEARKIMNAQKALLLSVAIGVFPAVLWAGEQEAEKRYRIGGRTTVIVDNMYVFAGDDSNTIDAFSASYIGLSYGITL